MGKERLCNITDITNIINLIKCKVRDLFLPVVIVWNESKYLLQSVSEPFQKSDISCTLQAVTFSDLMAEKILFGFFSLETVARRTTLIKR